MVDYSTLRALALQLAPTAGRVVMIGPEYRRFAFGSTTGRRVGFAERAPLCTVAHELAHVAVWPYREHGDRWRSAVVRLEAPLLAAWADLHSARA